MKKLLFLLALMPTILLAQPGGGPPPLPCPWVNNNFPEVTHFDGNNSPLTNPVFGMLPWSFQIGQTPSQNTGPDADVSGIGTYTFVEASGNELTEFGFETECFNIDSVPGMELSFYYHMYGADIGMLDVFILEENGDTIEFWGEDGDQGNQWLYAVFDLDTMGISGNFRLMFRATTGNGYESDFAIDNIRIGPPLVVTYGCTNPLATNFDSTATIDDGSCTYPACTGIQNMQGLMECFPWAPNQAQISVSWDPPTNPGCQPTGFYRGTDPNNLQYQPYQTWNGNYFYGYVDATPVSDPIYYFIIETLDGSQDTLTLSVPNCGVGCLDSLASNYNPFAGVDNGSCQYGDVTACGDTLNQQISVTVTPDTYAMEIGWNIFSTDSLQTLLASEPNGFYQTTGVAVTTNYCIPINTEVEFELTDTYGDGMCGSCFGGVDGSVIVTSACGDTIFSLIPSDGDNANFGYSIFSDEFLVEECPPAVPLYGCKDPNYLEYNSLATNDDPSLCQTLAIPGCTDSNMFNYDPNANTMDLIPSCDYTLMLFDGGGDGWDGSYLGVVQDGTPIGAFTNWESQTTYTINISALTHIEFTFYPVQIGGGFGPGAGTTTDISQVGFKLYDPQGTLVYQKGNNPWLNPVEAGVTYTPTLNCGNYCIPFIYGCIDSTAYNFNSFANTDDGSCVYQPGCTDPLYLEYFEQGYTADVDDGSCFELVVYGCTDSTAFNYDATANLDNGGCIPKTYGCTDSTAFNYDANVNTDDGSCIPFIYGCTDAAAFNYDNTANTDDGSCIAVVFGCTDDTMWNYNPNANTDNGSCEPFVYGCTDSTAFNYDLLANTDDGTCYPILYGCTDSTALNYNPLANTDDNTCIPILLGCTDPSAINYNSLANTDDNSCIPTVLGCTDSTAFNYNPFANTDDGTCISVVEGCTDPTMFNFNPSANIDDGSCVPFIYGCTDPTMFNYDATANTDNGSCIPIINGCTDSTMWNYDPTANTDNGSCISFIYGCTDNTALNFNPLANTLDNSCCYIGGCTDSTALNYNEDACFDDGTCVVIIEGCADPNAYNFDPLVNLPDNTTCLYDAGCYGGPGEPYWLNDGCYAWVIDVDSYCCTDSWDVSCQSMYDYCEQGWPTNIEELGSGTIIVYPNPTTNILNIDTRLEVDIEIYNMVGKLVVSEQKSNKITLNHIPNGIYNLIITYDKLRITKKIIKQ